ncbi:hypothetical protein Ddye_009336 [Dipteronia dyeriana]|uniref:pyruvate decarboxylase n=1 Tax=Dipteronia dyeriana TaxID=168575 RepID=A0AAD9XB82_9ROSI|nr:hypothetical protein Ddye_009336 [Dipteronia dyeriana]
MVAGPKLRVSKACEAFLQLADSCGYAIAGMPLTKSLVPEDHPHFIGTYGNAFCGEIVETADASLFVGLVFDDFKSIGDTLLFRKNKAIVVEPERVLIPNGPIFGCVLMKYFLEALSKKLERNTTAYENHNRIYVPELEALPKSDYTEDTVG